ncbi:MAG: hypothetical protein AAGA32_20665 [Pseudomonadota bacterium]
MRDLEALEARLEAATGRIVAALTALAERRADGGASADQDALAYENARLTEALAKLEAERARDVAEIDTLIAQLKPLVEEA